MSTVFTKTVDDNPHGERILYLFSAVLFNIQGNYASLFEGKTRAYFGALTSSLAEEGQRVTGYHSERQQRRLCDER
jgi:hypothetical protein